MEADLSLNDIKEFSPEAFEDFRGEIYTLHKESKDSIKFNHDKVCLRRKDCLVGIHGDFNTHKLVSCLYGEIFCALVDNRKESKDYLKHKTFILSHANRKQLLIPPGIGNSFFVLSDFCVYLYKLSYIGEYTDHDKQFTLRWDDEKLNIFWPKSNPIVSERDSINNGK